MRVTDRISGVTIQGRGWQASDVKSLECGVFNID